MSGKYALLQTHLIETLEYTKIIASIPGIPKENVDVKTDTKTNEIFITTSKPRLPADVLEQFEFEKSATIKLAEKYDVKTPKVYVMDGFLTIIVTVSDDRITKIEIV
jgi:HSP20 family molecular chaperone IbpA